MSSKQLSGKKHKLQEAASAPRTHSTSATATAADNDDADFHDLPKEQPKKKQKHAASTAVAQPLLDPTTQFKQQKKQTPQQQQQQSKSDKKNKSSATVPVVGTSSVPLIGADDEEMDSGEDDGDSEAEGTQQKEVKIMTKTQAKEARVYDRPAVSAKHLLPDLQARTPAHIPITTQSSSSSSTSAASSSSSSAVTPASSQLLAPLEHAANSAVASTGVAAHRKVIVVLVKASLETVKTKKGYELISADSHKHILQKLSKNPSEYRPDILHQCLLTLLDSPLNKAGLLEVFIQTEKNVLIEVHSSIRIPRTFKRFAGLMVQLLHKLKIRSSDSSDMLLKVIRNPVTQHLPIGALKIGTSVTGDLVDIRELAENVVGANPTAPIVFCVGSHANGPADVDWTDKSIAISKYPLSASVALGRICNAFEGIWNIL